MRLRRPRAARAVCTHCRRRRARRFIEWHPGIEAWQCSEFASCDAAIRDRGDGVDARLAAVWQRGPDPKKRNGP